MTNGDAIRVMIRIVGYYMLTINLRIATGLLVLSEVMRLGFYWLHLYLEGKP